MKNLNIPLEDHEYERLLQLKEALKVRTWKELLFYPVNHDKRKYIVEVIESLRLVFSKVFVENLKGLLLLIYTKNKENQVVKEFQKLISKISK